jgi:hypothetical protein
MVTSYAGPGPHSDCSGKVQKQLYEEITAPSYRRRGRPHIKKPAIVSTEKRREKLVAGPRWVPDTKMGCRS